MVCSVRSILAIEITPGTDERWFVGPPYAVPEVVFDEISIRGAYRSEVEALRDAVAESDEGTHPGYSQEVMSKLMNVRVMAATRDYPRRRLLRFDRLDASGEVLHPYGAEPGKDGWQVLVYLPYTGQFTTLPEDAFVRLQAATRDDLRRRSQR